MKWLPIKILILVNELKLNWHKKIIFKSLILMVINKGFRTSVFVFIFISITFQLICPPAFFRYLSNSGTYTELRITSFTESTGSPVQCKFLGLINLMFSHWTAQQDTLRNSYRRWFPKLLRRQSSGGCRFKPDYWRVTIQEYLTLVPDYD